jgi:hypothetical protein
LAAFGTVSGSQAAFGNFFYIISGYRQAGTSCPTSVLEIFIRNRMFFTVASRTLNLMFYTKSQQNIAKIHQLLQKADLISKTSKIIFS